MTNYILKNAMTINLKLSLVLEASPCDEGNLIKEINYKIKKPGLEAIFHS